MIFLLVACVAVFLLRGFASEQLREENEPASRTAMVVAVALNQAIKGSADPDRLLQSFAASLTPAADAAISFQRVRDDGAREATAVDTSGTIARAPSWFVRFLDLPNITQRHPILLNGQRVGDIVFDPKLTADIHEKWIGFLAIMTAGIGLAIATIIMAYLTIGTALRPLRDLGLGLARLRAGNYVEPIACGGPPEILLSCGAANDLGATLDAFHVENRSLLRRMVSIQDDERRDIARELHDELGPLLFSIRANATAMVDANPDRDNGPVQRVIHSVEALQSTNRRILDRLRPHYIDDLGLVSSIDALVESIRSQFPDIAIHCDIDPGIGAAAPVVAQTVYRALQEGMTNVLRHAEARKARLMVAVRDAWVEVEVRDDGIGLPEDFAMGRGLTGMRERVRALGGSFEIVRIDTSTIVRCRVPMGQSD